MPEPNEPGDELVKRLHTEIAALKRFADNQALLVLQLRRELREQDMQIAALAARPFLADPRASVGRALAQLRQTYTDYRFRAEPICKPGPLPKKPEDAGYLIVSRLGLMPCQEE